ncbi:TPA: type II toxin-antitoxin system RelB/DinJ family antitoxin [Streptococcus suis]
MVQVAIRVDDKLKDEAAELFQSLGLDMSTAIKMFLIQSVRTQSIPFSVSLSEPVKVTSSSDSEEG